MNQEEKIGTPAPEKGEPLASDTGKTAVPGVIYPRCPHCAPDGPTAEDGTRKGDPLRMWRLRYDFPDGVVAEVLFCGDCRVVINATLVGYTPAARSREMK